MPRNKKPGKFSRVLAFLASIIPTAGAKPVRIPNVTPDDTWVIDNEFQERQAGDWAIVDIRRENEHGPPSQATTFPLEKRPRNANAASRPAPFPMPQWPHPPPDPSSGISPFILAPISADPTWERRHILLNYVVEATKQKWLRDLNQHQAMHNLHGTQRYVQMLLAF